MESTAEAPAEKLNIINASTSLADPEKEGSEKVISQKTTKDGIVLVPQPSDDPEEPLVIT